MVTEFPNGVREESPVRREMYFGACRTRKTVEKNRRSLRAFQNSSGRASWEQIMSPATRI